MRQTTLLHTFTCSDYILSVNIHVISFSNLTYIEYILQMFYIGTNLFSIYRDDYSMTFKIKSNHKEMFSFMLRTLSYSRVPPFTMILMFN